MAALGREVPIQVQVTMEVTGTMLPGTEMGAALAALDAMRPAVLGVNCATGPAEMSEHLRYLGQHARMPIACLPNAGMPSVVDGPMRSVRTRSARRDWSISPTLSPTATATETAMHRSPADPNAAPMSASTARSTSASGMTTR